MHYTDQISGKQLQTYTAKVYIFKSASICFNRAIRYIVLLMSKLTLACGKMRVFLYFCRVTQSELACDTRVNFRVEHASYNSCAAQDPSLRAARL